MCSGKATKKGNTDRVYRNTLVFLVCSEQASVNLHAAVREYLACAKINLEYNSQLEKEQKDDVRRRMDESSRTTESAMAAAYSIAVRYHAKSGPEALTVRQFRDSMDSQLSTHFLQALREEEWLLDSVGLGILKSHNLYPTVNEPLRAKDIYEAFLRYDDKPMISGPDAIKTSLLRYCGNGEFAIAAGEPGHFTRIFLSEQVPFLDVTDPTFWVVDKSLKPAEAPGTPQQQSETDGAVHLVSLSAVRPATLSGESTSGESQSAAREVRFVAISGKVPMEHYSQIFQSFILPLSKNNVEIEIRIKGKSTSAKPLTENSQEYKIVKESAKQLGLEFEEG